MVSALQVLAYAISCTCEETSTSVKTGWAQSGDHDGLAAEVR